MTKSPSNYRNFLQFYQSYANVWLYGKKNLGLQSRYGCTDLQKTNYEAELFPRFSKFILHLETNSSSTSRDADPQSTGSSSVEVETGLAKMGLFKRSIKEKCYQKRYFQT